MKSSRRALLAAVGASTLAGCSTVRDVTGPDFERVPEPEPGADSWLAPGWGPRNRNANPEASIPDREPSLRWRASTGDTPVDRYSGPLVSDGVVVVGHGNGIDAFDAADGGERWAVSMGEDSYVYPTIVDGTVYTGSTRGFHAFSLDGGSERWAVTADSLPMTTLDDLSTARAPVVVHGWLFASTANYVLSLDAAGSVRWWADAAFSSLLEAPLATDGSDVFVRRGGQVGSFDLPIDPWQGPLDVNRRVPKKTGRRWHPYVEAYGGPLVGDGVVYQPRHSDDETSVVVLDVETGERRWGVQTTGDAAAIALQEDTLFVRDWGGWLYGVDATTGEKQWTREVDPDADASTGQPITGDDGVVVPTDNGVLAFSASGDERWRLPDVSAQRMALVDGRLYLVVYTGDEDSAVRDDDYELRCYA